MPPQGGIIFGRGRMKGTPAVYLGRIVDKEYFRVVVYGPNGEKRLVKSWDEYEAAMQSGIWFATVEDAASCKAEPGIEMEYEPEIKPKPKTKSKPKPKTDSSKVSEPAQKAQVIPDDGMGFEVKEGDE